MLSSISLAARWLTVSLLATVVGLRVSAQTQPPPPPPAADPVATLVKQLELEKYKATIKGLTQFGDRRQGTERNRKAVDYPAAVGFHMTNADSGPFMDLIPAISLRENERGMHIGAGWDPNWHQPSDVSSTYSDQDFRLGLNAAQTTLAAIVQLTGATIRK